MTHRIRGGYGFRAAATLAALFLIAASEIFLRARHRRRVLPSGATVAGGQIALVALGDSITAGAPGGRGAAWPALLADWLHQRYPDLSWSVVNAGVPGDTAPQGFARFDREVASAGPRLVLMAFGLNDCNPARYGMDRWYESSVPGGLARSYLWRALQVRVVRIGQVLGWLPRPGAENARQSQPRTSPQGFAVTLDALIDRTQEMGAQPVLLTMTPLATAETPGVLGRLPTYGGYNRIIRERARDRHVPLIELALLAGDYRGRSVPPEAFEDDGFHLTAVGQAWVAGQVFLQGETAGIWMRLAREARP